MSEDKKNQDEDINVSSETKAVPTNDEVIDELTRNVEQNCILNNKSEDDKDFDIPESSEIGDNVISNENDYIDEEALKEENLNLTEEDKEKRHKESIELKNVGNDFFKSGDYSSSIEKYTEALKLCPLQFEGDRSILYSNRAASKIKLNRNKSAIDDCTRSIELNGTYIKSYHRRAKLYEETDKLDESLEDWKKLFELDINNTEAKAAIVRLPPLITERNEKLKTEMMGKLKDLGNLILRPFGLSTENFNLQQDPNTGGYSVNFQQSK